MYRRPGLPSVEPEPWGKEHRLGDDDAGARLLAFHEIPAWQQDNEYILSGYRYWPPRPGPHSACVY